MGRSFISNQLPNPEQREIELRSIWTQAPNTLDLLSNCIPYDHFKSAHSLKNLTGKVTWKILVQLGEGEGEGERERERFVHTKEALFNIVYKLLEKMMQGLRHKFYSNLVLFNFRDQFYFFKFLVTMAHVVLFRSN
jgi:hypothetical protein